MNTYTLTITATFEAEDIDQAITIFAEWLSQPHNVEDGTVVQIEDEDGVTIEEDGVTMLIATSPEDYES